MNSLSAARALSEFIAFSRKNVENAVRFLSFFKPLKGISNMQTNQNDLYSTNIYEVLIFNYF